ncbi:hypothetical protein Tco_0020419 [Tanacetum coccineum]
MDNDGENGRLLGEQLSMMDPELPFDIPQIKGASKLHDTIAAKIWNEYGELRMDTIVSVGYVIVTTLLMSRMLVLSWVMGAEPGKFNTSSDVLVPILESHDFLTQLFILYIVVLVPILLEVIPPLIRYIECIMCCLGFDETDVEKPRNPPWIQCCIKSYGIGDTDLWKFLTYGIFDTTLEGCIGGKQEGEEQDDEDGNVKRKSVPQITLVNYFFTNFPPEWNEGNLREVFAELGEVADVYVAILEKRLNKIWNGSFKLRANVAKFERSFSKFRQGCKKARKINSNPSGLDKIPSKNLTGWLQNALVGESILIHSPSELQSILFQPFNVSDCKVKHLGGVGEEVKHTFDLRSDRIDPIVEGGFSSNRGELKVGEKEKLNLKVDVVQQQDLGDDDKDVKPSDPEINGKGDEIISGSPITIGLVGILLSHNGDGDNSHGDDGFGDVEGTVTEKAPHDVDTSVTRESKAVVTMVCQIVKRFGTLFLRR